MIDYTYWQEKVRVRLESNDVAYRAVRLENTVSFLIGLRKMSAADEANWQNFLTYFAAAEDRSAKWLFHEQGEIILSGKINGLSEDEITLIGLSCGIEEIYFDEHKLAHFFCTPRDLAKITDILSLEDVEIVRAFTGYRPEGLVEIYDKAQAKKVYDFCETLSETEFVVDICADFGIGEYWIEEFKTF